MSDHHEEEEDRPLRVGAGTDCKFLAGAIAGKVEHKRVCIIEYIGAGAGNQAVKAVIIANGMLAKHGFYISVVPKFVPRVVKGDSISAIQLNVIPHAVVV